MPYYNAMLQGSDWGTENCNKVYDRLKGYKVFVIRDCGYGPDASCNKYIRYDGNDGIKGARSCFEQVIENLELDLEYTVKSGWPDWFFVPDSLKHFTAQPPPVSRKAVWG